MNLVACLLAGGVLGWIANHFMQLEHPRGLTNSIAVGVAAALVGLWVTTSMAGGESATPVGFSSLSLVVSVGFAIALLAVMHLVRRVRAE
jgi:uncharacterized membrane protein YeaQ/YmgE (transglycosylase-associated protein family)